MAFWKKKKRQTTAKKKTNAASPKTHSPKTKPVPEWKPTIPPPTYNIQLSLLGVAAYIKVGNTFTEPIADGDSMKNYWFTMMYFSDVWATRRLVRKMDELLKGESDERTTD